MERICDCNVPRKCLTCQYTDTATAFQQMYAVYYMYTLLQWHMLKRSKTKHSSLTCVLEQPSQADQLSGDQGPHWQCTGSDTDLMDLTALIQEQAQWKSSQTSNMYSGHKKYLDNFTLHIKMSNQMTLTHFSELTLQWLLINWSQVSSPQDHKGVVFLSSIVITGVVHQFYYEYATKHLNSFIKIII